MRERSEINVGPRAGNHVPVTPRGTEELVGVASDYRLAGVDWGYYSKMTHILEYTYNQPEGFAGHLAWQGDGEWRVQNLWRDEEARERFFAEFAAERLSRGIQLLGAVSTIEGVTDVEPVPSEIVKFIAGPRARAFTDIGEDRDGSAINALGGEPVVIELEIGGMRTKDYETLAAGLGYDAAVPAELILHHATKVVDGMRILEAWSGHESAHAELSATLLPAIDRLADKLGRDFLCVQHEYALSRISLSPTVVAAFGF